MGDWTITITGHGIHDNGRQDDANVMAAYFVAELREAGHEVRACTFSLDHGDGTATGRSLLDDVPSVASPSMVHYPTGLDDPQPYTPPS